VVKLKSGAFFSGAFILGGLAGGATREGLQYLGSLGEEYGIMIQIHDDLRDALEVPANPDWHNDRLPLPVLFAHTVDHPWRARFNAIRKSVSDPELLKEAQEILLRSGAISYGLFQIQEHYQTALALLEKLSVKDKSKLGKLFNELVVPVDELISEFTENTAVMPP